jgi:ABC-2 type transport system ATP-binding protein
LAATLFLQADAGPGAGRYDPSSPEAVSAMDLTVAAGSLTGFIGPNGAGKSTTIRMIMSIIRPDSGTVDVLAAPRGRRPKGGIGPGQAAQAARQPRANVVKTLTPNARKSRTLRSQVRNLG